MTYGFTRKVLVDGTEQQLSSPFPLAAARHHVKAGAAAVSAQAVLVLPFIQRIWMQIVFLLQASNRMQVPNSHYYFTCLEMGIVSTLINDLKDCLISVTTSVGC